VTGGEPTLDSDTVGELRRLAAENPTFLPQLVRIFAANAPGRLAAIREAIARRDGAAIEATAHTLRSNCSMLGAMRMAEYCRQFEALAARQAFDEAAALVAEADAEFERVRGAVAALCPPGV
jgi:HPt (histidine-containing phosphotransfer) domain-containing protein